MWASLGFFYMGFTGFLLAGSLVLGPFPRNEAHLHLESTGTPSSTRFPDRPLHYLLILTLEASDSADYSPTPPTPLLPHPLGVPCLSGTVHRLSPCRLLQ